MSSTIPQSEAAVGFPSSSVDIAYDEILKRIVTGKLREGEPVKGSVLARSLELSRTPVVQAINRLCAAGILEQQLNHRATVATGAEQWFMSLHEVRILLEPQAARAATGTLDSEGITKLNALASRFERESEFEKKREAAFHFDHELHTSIARASGNLMIQSIIQQCMGFKRFAYRVPNDTPERLDRSHREHLEIIRAIEKQDGETASAAMLFHLRSTSRDLPNTHVV